VDVILVAASTDTHASLAAAAIGPVRPMDV
jgi:hypothetical protein